MNDMDTTKELIKEIWELWESMAECGELHIGPQFSANYKRLKAQVEQKLNLSGIGSKRLLEDVDTLLAQLEDTAHGEEGKRITEMRGRVQAACATAKGGSAEEAAPAAKAD